MMCACTSVCVYVCVMEAHNREIIRLWMCVCANPREANRQQGIMQVKRKDTHTHTSDVDGAGNRRAPGGEVLSE